MDNKEKNLQDIVNCGVVAVIRVASAQEAVEVCGAIAKGGVKPIEITMTVPGAIDATKELKGVMKDNVLLGAGTFKNAVIRVVGMGTATTQARLESHRARGAQASFATPFEATVNQ